AARPLREARCRIRRLHPRPVCHARERDVRQLLHEGGRDAAWSSRVFGHVFMNPPYGRAIGRWMAKAWEESQRGPLVVCLVPAGSDTGGGHDYAMRGEMKSLGGRLCSGNATNSAPSPPAVVVSRPPTSPQYATASA